jgi:hypothetical protein
LAGVSTAERADSITIKTIETTKSTNAKTVKSSIRSMEGILFAPPSGSKTTLALEIKLQQ